MILDRARLVELAERLMSGDYQSDEDLDKDMAAFRAGVRHPRASDLIFYWDSEFDREPSPEEVVDRALSYRPVEL